MFPLRSLLVAATAISCIFATPNSLSPRQTLTLPEEGVHDGYFYTFWTDGILDVEFTLGPAGVYNATWSGEGAWIGGKGWNPGSPTR